MGESGEGKNVTHQQKKLDEDELRHFRTRFQIPISDEQIADAPFYRPPDDSPEIKYLQARRKELGGYVPKRSVRSKPLVADHEELFHEFYTGSEGREVSTTMAFVGMLRKMLRDPEIGKLVVPIVPDEARTFGMESLFRNFGIYSSRGQLYEPVDMHTLLYYKEAKDGQILEEGITEAGSMSSFIAAGSAYATHGINTIPFFIYYSMFGLQRIGDLIWAAADMRCRGFLLGGTAGRTTLAGEGLQHQDGNSHVLALAGAHPARLRSRLCLRTCGDHQRRHRPHVQEGREHLLLHHRDERALRHAGYARGLAEKEFSRACTASARPRTRKPSFALSSSAAALFCAKRSRAQEILEEKYNVAADVWSVTSYKALYYDGIETERWNYLHPGEKPRVPYVTQCLADAPGVFVAASDYLKTLPNLIDKWMPRRLASLGHRWLWPQRKPGLAARFLRSGCALHRRGHAL